MQIVRNMKIVLFKVTCVLGALSIWINKKRINVTSGQSSVTISMSSITISMEFVQFQLLSAL